MAGFATGFTIGTGFGIAVGVYLVSAGFGVTVTAQNKANEIGELQDTAFARYTNVKNQSSIYIYPLK